MSVKLSPMQQAFKDFQESEDYRDCLAISRVFGDSEGLAWPMFIAGWEEAVRRSVWFVISAFVFGVVFGWLM